MSADVIDLKTRRRRGKGEQQRLRPASKPRRASSGKHKTRKRRAQRESLAGFRRFCAGLKLEGSTKSKPRYMTLEPFQAKLLRDYFDGRRETLVLIPKKNGKTTLLAALALYHMVSQADPFVCIAASTRDQAMILFDKAKGFVDRSPELKAELKVLRGYREIRLRDPENPFDPKEMRGLLKVYAADEDSADGVEPTLALVDELHRHKSPELYGVFRDGLGTRPGRMITISTAGDDENSPLGTLRASAHALPGQRRRSAYRYAHNENFALHEWALRPRSKERLGDDVEDMRVVKRANPASWQTEEELRIRHDSPSMRPWQWARFACGLWVAGEESVITGSEWGAIAKPRKAVIPEGAEGVHVGIDLGWKWDTTAIMPLWRPELDEPCRIAARQGAILVPPRDGSMLAAERIHEVLEELADGLPHDKTRAVLDPNAGGEALAQWIESELGWEVVQHSQKATHMALAAQRFVEGVASADLIHDDEQELNGHVLAAAAKAVGEGFRFVKMRKKAKPIDGLIACAMPYSVMLSNPAPSREDFVLEVL